MAAILFPSSWLWGFDAPANLGPGVRILAIALLAAAALPRAGDAVLRSSEAAFRRLRGLSPALILGGAAALAILRCRTFLLGDAQTWLSAIDRGVRSAGGAHREPLPQALVIGMHDRIVRPLGGNPHLTFTLVEIPLAILHLTLAFLLARRIGTHSVSRALVVAAIALSGGLQLYGGYPEFYGFVLVAMLLFALLALRALDRGVGFVPAALAFALAVVCHAQALFALPALVYLGWRLARAGRGREVLLGSLLLPAVVIGILLFVRYPFGELRSEASSGANFLPPLGQWTRRTAYGIFSPRHLIELLNVFLLVAPAFAVLVPLAISARMSLRRPSVRFLWLLGAGPFLFALAANPQLGMVRDWDIFALPAVALALACAAAARVEETPRLRALAGSLILACFLHATGWIATNHHPSAGAERIRRVARNASLFGPQSLGEVWRYLGSADMMSSRIDRAAESYLRSILADPEERMSYRFLAGVRIEQAVQSGGRVEGGLASYHASLEGTPARKSLAHMGAAFAAFSSRRLDLALSESERMVAAEPLRAESQATRGDFLRISGDLAAARACYARAIERDPDLPRARIGIACLEGLAGNEEGVRRELAEATRRTPWAPLVQQFARATQEQGSSRAPAFYQSFIFLR